MVRWAIKVLGHSDRYPAGHLPKSGTLRSLRILWFTGAIPSTQFPRIGSGLSGKLLGGRGKRFRLKASCPLVPEENPGLGPRTLSAAGFGKPSRETPPGDWTG